MVLCTLLSQKQTQTLQLHFPIVSYVMKHYNCKIKDNKVKNEKPANVNKKSIDELFRTAGVRPCLQRKCTVHRCIK